jgi:anti-sigma factor RsiW
MAACGSARRALWPDSGPRRADARVAAARRHVEGCGECRAFFAEMEQLRMAVKAAATEPIAPPSVHERVFARRATASAAVKLRRRTWMLASAAAVVAVIAVLAARSLVKNGAAELAAVLAQSHAASLGGDRIASSDPGRIEQWISARLTFAVYVPVFPSARLAGARIDVSERGRGAAIEYQIGDKVVSYFVLPERAEVDASPDRLLHAHASGYRAVIWTDAGLLHAMVGAVPSVTLETLARECVKQMRQGGRQVAVGTSTNGGRLRGR